MPEAHNRDLGFFYWAGVGFMIVFGALAILSIGAPFFLVGLVCLVIAAIDALGGAATWAAVGVILVALSSASFWALRCRPLPR